MQIQTLQELRMLSSVTLNCQVAAGGIWARLLILSFANFARVGRVTHVATQITWVYKTSCTSRAIEQSPGIENINWKDKLDFRLDLVWNHWIEADNYPLFTFLNWTKPNWVWYNYIFIISLSRLNRFSTQLNHISYHFFTRLVNICIAPLIF